MGIDRHQIIEAVGLHAMAGKIKQRDVGADQFGAEFLQRRVKAVLVQVKLGAAADHEEAERQQRIRHQLGVGRGVRQLRDGLIGRIADHQRDALFGMRGGAGAEQKAATIPRHEADPTGHDDALRGGEIPASPVGLAGVGIGFEGAAVCSGFKTSAACRR